MNIIFIAPPAAGKGTQSELICKNYNMKHVSTGDLIREAINKGDESSIYLKETIEQGKLVSDDFILNLIKLKLNEENDYIFDGFPRNVKQAELFDSLLEKVNSKIDYVFYLNVDKDLAEKRITGRISCPKCGRVYNEKIEENMPKQVNTCDDCNESLVKRSDDNAETFNMRFDTYMKETEPVIQYYKDKNLLYELDSSLSKFEVFEQIKNIIGVK